jgi:hypothetical protein
MRLFAFYPKASDVRETYGFSPATSLFLVTAVALNSHNFPTDMSVRFQILTATCMKMAVFWNVPACIVVCIDRRFIDAYCLHYQVDDDDDDDCDGGGGSDKFL